MVSSYLFKKIKASNSTIVFDLNDMDTKIPLM